MKTIADATEGRMAGEHEAVILAAGTSDGLRLADDEQAQVSQAGRNPIAPPGTSAWR
jgi:hypothetical protein